MKAISELKYFDIVSHCESFYENNVGFRCIKKHSICMPECLDYKEKERVNNARGNGA